MRRKGRWEGLQRGKVWAVVFIGSVTPLLMGGCPDFQNATVDAFLTATRTVLNAALDLAFDQYRAD